MAVRERTVAGLYEPIQRIVRAIDQAGSCWRRHDLAALEAAMQRLTAEADAYVERMAGQ
jgi:hypothetical protein